MNKILPSKVKFLVHLCKKEHTQRTKWERLIQKNISVTHVTSATCPNRSLPLCIHYDSDRRTGTFGSLRISQQ